jgi:hypothetical protein
MQRALAWCTFLVAVCCYLNTLPATFTFDDNFAVVRRAPGSAPGRCQQAPSQRALLELAPLLRGCR